MLQIRTLGQVSVRRSDGSLVSGLPPESKRFCFLVLVALTGSRRRDQLASLLWPDLDQEHARGALRQTLRFLRRALGEETFLNHGDEEIGIDRTRVWCDAVELRMAAAGAPAQAIGLYEGDFLDGVFVANVAQEYEEWVATERAQLQRVASQAAWSAAECRSRESDPAGAAALARQAFALARFDESQLARLLIFLDRSGDRAGALAAYEDFVLRLQQQLGAEPSPETQALVRRIRARTIPASESAPPPGPVPQAAGSGPVVPPVDATPRDRWSRSAAALVAAGLAIMLLGGWWIAAHRGVRPIDSVAVLPIDIEPGDTTLQYLADGLADRITDRLATSPGLAVASRSALHDLEARAHDQRRDYRQIGRSLGVTAVAAGTLRREGDSLWLETGLIRVADGIEISRNRRPVSLVGLERLEIQVAEAIAGALHIRPALRTIGSADGEAYLLTVRGQYYLGQRSEADIRRARDLFAEAIERDPASGEAYLGLSYAYGAFAHSGLLPSVDAFRLSVAAARKALRLKPRSGMALALIATAEAFQEWRWNDGEQMLRQAVAAEPDNADVHNLVGIYWRVLGRFDDAVREMRLAHALEPLARHFAFQEAGVFLCAGRYDSALAVLKEAIEIGNRYSRAHLAAAAALAALGRFPEALAERKAAALADGDSVTAAAIDPGSGQRGFLALTAVDLRATLRQLEERARTGYVPPSVWANAYAAAGDWKRALQWLDRARADHDVTLIKVGCNRDYDPIRTDPRFRQIMMAVGVPADPRGA